MKQNKVKARRLIVQHTNSQIHSEIYVNWHLLLFHSVNNHMQYNYCNMTRSYSYGYFKLKEIFNF